MICSWSRGSVFRPCPEREEQRKSEKEKLTNPLLPAASVIVSGRCATKPNLTPLPVLQQGSRRMRARNAYRATERGGWCLIVGGGGGGDGDVAWYTAAWVQRGARRAADIMRGKGSWLHVVGERRKKERTTIERGQSAAMFVSKVRTYDGARQRVQNSGGARETAV
nr:PREDICTED: uncharacterized protein LOC105663288 [Megachile rotundata]